MTRNRSIIAGFTDYTGVDIYDIIEHMKEWLSDTKEAIDKLKDYKKEVKLLKDRLDDPDDILDYIHHFIDLFERYSNDFSRLINELAVSVEPRHIETVKQIRRSSDYEEKSCVQFKSDHIATTLEDESLRNTLLDPIYEDTRGIIVNYYDLSNVSSRLEALVGTQTSGKIQTDNNLDALELKPNLFGIGINLNYLLKKLFYIFRRK